MAGFRPVLTPSVVICGNHDTRLGLKRLLERVGSPRRVDLRSLTVQRPQAVVLTAGPRTLPRRTSTGAAEGAGCMRDLHVDSQLVLPANIRIQAPASTQCTQCMQPARETRGHPALRPIV